MATWCGHPQGTARATGAEAKRKGGTEQLTPNGILQLLQNVLGTERKLSLMYQEWSITAAPNELCKFTRDYADVDEVLEICAKLLFGNLFDVHRLRIFQSEQEEKFLEWEYPPPEKLPKWIMLVEQSNGERSGRALANTHELFGMLIFDLKSRAPVLIDIRQISDPQDLHPIPE